MRVEICIGNVERVEVGNVVAADLVRPYEELHLITSARSVLHKLWIYLEVFGDVVTSSDVHLWTSASWNGNSAGCADEARRRCVGGR